MIVIVISLLFILAGLDFLIIFVLGISLNIDIRKLYRYLRTTGRSKRWEWITTVWGFGPGGVNSLRLCKYLHNDMDSEDPTVADFKRSLGKRSATIIKLGLVFVFILFATGATILILAATGTAGFHLPN